MLFRILNSTQQPGYPPERVSCTRDDRFRPLHMQLHSAFVASLITSDPAVKRNRYYVNQMRATLLFNSAVSTTEPPWRLPKLDKFLISGEVLVNGL